MLGIWKRGREGGKGEGVVNPYHEDEELSGKWAYMLPFSSWREAEGVGFPVFAVAVHIASVESIISRTHLLNF